MAVNKFASRIKIYCPGESRTKDNKINKTVKFQGMMTGKEAWTVLNNYQTLLDVVPLGTYHTDLHLYESFFLFSDFIASGLLSKRSWKTSKMAY